MDKHSAFITEWANRMRSASTDLVNRYVRVKLWRVDFEDAEENNLLYTTNQVSKLLDNKKIRTIRIAGELILDE